jgi:hypothetical protein
VTAGAAVIPIANLIAEAVIRDQVTDAAKRWLRSPVTVSTSGAPALVEAIEHKVASVHLDSGAVYVCAVLGARVSATVRDLARHGSGVSVGSTDAELTLGTRALTQRLPGALVQLNASDGALDVQAGPSGLVSLTLRP